jgi:hypothetical protein
VAQGFVRDYLRGTLEGLGLEPALQAGRRVAMRRPFGEVTIENVVVRLPGSASTGAVLLVAHYDSTPGGPGAADDGAAVAAILETLRALRDGAALRNDLVCLLTDGEELGLLGAHLFEEEHPWARDVAVVLNWEARGNAGATLMFETSRGNGALVAHYAAAAPRPAANSFMSAVYRRMPNDTDFTVFRRAGIPGLNFAFIEGYTSYHGPEDRPEALSRASLQDHGDTMLALVRRLGHADLGALESDDAIYFELLGAVLVRYPATWTWPLTTLALAVLAGVFVRGVRAGRMRAAGIAQGLGATAFATALGTVLAWQLGRVVISVFPAVVSHPARGTENDFFFMLAMTLFAASATVWSLAFAAKRVGRENALAGALGAWAIGLLAATLFLPGATFLFLWPLVGGIAALALPPSRSPLVAALLVVPALVLGVPMIQRFFVAMTLDKAAVVVPLVVLFGSLLLLPFPRLLAERSREAYLVTAGAGMACLAWGLATL